MIKIICIIHYYNSDVFIGCLDVDVVWWFKKKKSACIATQKYSFTRENWPRFANVWKDAVSFTRTINVNFSTACSSMIVTVFPCFLVWSQKSTNRTLGLFCSMGLSIAVTLHMWMSWFSSFVGLIVTILMTPASPHPSHTQSFKTLELNCGVLLNLFL